MPPEITSESLRELIQNENSRIPEILLRSARHLAPRWNAAYRPSAGIDLPQTDTAYNNLTNVYRMELQEILADAPRPDFIDTGSPFINPINRPQAPFFILLWDAITAARDNERYR